MHIKFTILLLLIAKIVIPQGAGYMGKKMVAGYGFYFSPGYIGSKGTTPVNMLHEGFLEYAASKNFSIGFSAKRYNAVYENGRTVDFTYNSKNTYNYYSYSGNNYSDVPEGSFEISAINYMLYGKIFSHNYVAPWGRYFTFGITLNTFKARYDPNSMNILIYDYNYYNSSTVKFSDFGPIEQSFKKFDIMIGSGRSRVIANRIIIDYGYNANLLAVALTLFDAPDDNIFGDENLTASDYIPKTSAARIRGVNRFNVFLKVGLLLF